MLNKVILIGRLANDPELKYTPSGIAVTTFRIAVDRPISAEARQQGKEKEADFIDIVAWRQAAEFASNYLGKGRLVAVDGRLQIRQFVDKDGNNRRASEVVVEQLKSLERPRDTEGGEGGGSGYSGGNNNGYNRQNQGGSNGGGGGGYNRGASGGATNNGDSIADDTGFGDEPPASGGARRPAASPATAAPAPQRGGQGNYGGNTNRGGGAAPSNNNSSAEVDPFADDLDDPFADE